MRTMLLLDCNCCASLSLYMFLVLLFFTLNFPSRRSRVLFAGKVQEWVTFHNHITMNSTMDTLPYASDDDGQPARCDEHRQIVSD